MISRLIENADFRASYLGAKLNISIPSQIRALRRRQDLTQAALAGEAGMKQSRISAMERPGETKFNLETLIRVAAAFKVGLIVRFVPFSDVLRWENGFSQDAFDVTTIEEDTEFINPGMQVPSQRDSLPSLHGLMNIPLAGPRKVPSEPKPAGSETGIHFVPRPGVSSTISINQTAPAEKQILQELRA